MGLKIILPSLLPVVHTASHLRQRAAAGCREGERGEQRQSKKEPEAAGNLPA